MVAIFVLFSLIGLLPQLENNHCHMVSIIIIRLFLALWKEGRKHFI